MRCVSSIGVALLTISLASGCSSFGPPPPGNLAAGGSAAVLPAQGGGASPAASGFGAVTAAGSSVVSGVTGVFKRGSSALTATVTHKNPPVAANDPTSLSNTSGKVTPDLQVTLAQMKESSGDLSGAKKQYEAVLKKNPRNLEALLGLAHLLDRQGQLDEAIAKYRLACKYHPKEARALNDLGLCLARQRKYDESLKTLAKAIQLEPRKKLYRNNIATVLAEAGRSDEALSQLTAAHGPALAHYNLGCLLYQKGNRAEAAAQFAAATTIDPSFTAARQWSEQLAGNGRAPATSRPPVAPGAIAVSTPSSAPVGSSRAMVAGENYWLGDRRSSPTPVAPTAAPATVASTATPAAVAPSGAAVRAPQYVAQREALRPLPPVETE